MRSWLVALQGIDALLRDLNEANADRRELVALYRKMEAEPSLPPAQSPASPSPAHPDETGGNCPATEGEENGNWNDGWSMKDVEARCEAEGEPISDLRWESLQTSLWGGWRELSEEAADFLKEIGQSDKAAEIRNAMNELPKLFDESRVPESDELAAFRDAERCVAERVRAILVEVLNGRSGKTQSGARGLTADERAEEGDPARRDESNPGDVVRRIAAVYAGKALESRFGDIAGIVEGSGTVDERLRGIHKVLPIPLDASADALAGLLRVTATAIKTAGGKDGWWAKNRAGKRAEKAAGERKARLKAWDQRCQQPDSD